MNQCAIELGRISTLVLLSAGIAFSPLHARAEEPGQQVAALETPRPRAAMPVLTVGGLRPGQVMVIGAGTTEVMSAASYAQRPVITPAMKAMESCIVK